MSNEKLYATLFTPQDKSHSDLLTREEAAHYLGVTPRTLAVWACVKRYNLPYVKVGRLVKYKKEHLQAFIDRRTIMQAEGNDHE